MFERILVGTFFLSYHPAFMPSNDKGIWIYMWEARKEMIKLNERITNTVTDIATNIGTQWLKNKHYHV